MRKSNTIDATASLPRLAMVALVGLSLAGCSADVVRLDSSPSFSLNDPPGARTLRPSAGLNRSAVGASTVDVAPTQTYSPPALPDRGIEVAALPPPTSPAPVSVPAYNAPPPVQTQPTSSGSATPAVAPPRKPAPVATTEKGVAIEVKPGDTLYGLAKQHNASISDMMQVNGLTSAALKPGQTLYLPKTVRKPISRTEAAATQAPPVASPDVAARYTGTYIVQKGDSMYALALKLKVPMVELQQVNGIPDVRKVKPGMVLKVPGSAVAAAPVPQQTAPVTAPGPKVPATVVQKELASSDNSGGPVVPPARPVLINGDKQVAAVDPTADVKPAAASGTVPVTDTSSEARPAAGPATVSGTNAGRQAAAGGAVATATGELKLRWPVRGKIIAGFGPRPDGTHNDGVNVQVPQGIEVLAAEAGSVAYAGSELKGYGNLVLVRHDNGWITAYAHNSEILVKRGDRVKRGQPLAKSGKSGQVDQSQVHFELRQGSKPVDPMPFMEKM